jgi:hypothetical protein
MKAGPAMIARCSYILLQRDFRSSNCMRQCSSAVYAEATMRAGKNVVSDGICER